MIKECRSCGSKNTDIEGNFKKCYSCGLRVPISWEDDNEPKAQQVDNFTNSVGKRRDDIDEIAYRRFKTDYKYIGLDVCKVQVLEEYIASLGQPDELSKAQARIRELEAELKNKDIQIRRLWQHRK